MKKMILAAVSALLLCAGVSAQSNDFANICKKFSAHKNIVGKFIQEKTIAKGNRTLKSNGNFVFCADGFMWQTEKPFKSSMIVTKKALIQIAPNGKKTVTEAGSSQVFATVSSKITAFFAGDYEVLEKDFDVDFKAAGGNWSAVLTPKSKTIATVMKSVSISGKYTESDATFDTIIMKESNDNKTGYYLSEQKYPEDLSADEKAYFAEK